MPQSAFKSPGFYLSVWTNQYKKNEDETFVYKVGNDKIAISKNQVRTICSGNNCSLAYDNKNKLYITTGNCKRSNFCTELRIIKDNYFLKTGFNSNTLNAINFGKDLHNWKKEAKLDHAY